MVKGLCLISDETTPPSSTVLSSTKPSPNPSKATPIYIHRLSSKQSAHLCAPLSLRSTTCPRYSPFFTASTSTLSPPPPRARTAACAAALRLTASWAAVICSRRGVQSGCARSVASSARAAIISAAVWYWRASQPKWEAAAAGGKEAGGWEGGERREEQRGGGGFSAGGCAACINRRTGKPAPSPPSSTLTWQGPKGSNVAPKLRQRLAHPLLVQQQHHRLEVHHLSAARHLRVPLRARLRPPERHAPERAVGRLVLAHRPHPVLPELRHDRQLERRRRAGLGRAAAQRGGRVEDALADAGGLERVVGGGSFQEQAAQGGQAGLQLVAVLGGEGGAGERVEGPVGGRGAGWGGVGCVGEGRGG